MMPVVRTRLALGLISLAAVGLELAFMQALSLRFWSHLAYMVIGVALLGFGASGTAGTLLRGAILRRPRAWLAGLALALAATTPLAWQAGRLVPLDVQYLAWNLSQAGNIVLLELLMFAPFLLAGAAVGVALMDSPGRIGGHYAANLVGAGAGAVACVLLMYVLDANGLVLVMAGAAWAGGAVLLPWPRPGAVIPAALSGAIIAAAAWFAPGGPDMSPYKMLSQARTWAGTREIYHTQGPLGRIDVLAGPAIHYAPGLSLQCPEPVPPHVLLILDGDQTSPVYDCRAVGDWSFLDWTTPAVAYRLCDRPRVCIIGAGGGSDIGLALLHNGRQIVALEANGQVIAAMTGPLADRGGKVYRAPGVRVVKQEARGFLASAGEPFDVIQFPAIDAFGASGAGLYAAQESYLYTVESVGSMIDRLADGGVLAITRWARTPPREELRALDTAAQALRKRQLEPAAHLAMIRGWATATVLVFKQPLSPQRAEAIRAFCRDRSFDLCWLPDLTADQSNRYHVLDRPYYFEAARALLGPGRREFLDSYPFQVAAATDEKPYFFHFFRWRSLGFLRGQPGGAGRAFLEVGYLMAWAALAQAVVLAAVLIVLPLAPRIGAVRSARGKPATLGYFLLLGGGFMLLEMGFLQKFILYLASPIYSAAVVIASFLVFAGLGSQLSGRWPAAPRRVAAAAGAIVAALALICLFGLDGWLRLTQGRPAMVRFLIAAGTIAPLAAAMGQMFPSGLRQIGRGAAPLVPWAWAVNGFASVAATVAAPLLAMSLGFSTLILAAAACYALAAVLAARLPG